VGRLRADFGSRRQLPHRQPAYGAVLDNAGIMEWELDLNAAATPAGAGTIITARDTIQAMLQSNIQ
jgi:hypothetical protein